MCSAMLQLELPYTIIIMATSAMKRLLQVSILLFNPHQIYSNYSWVLESDGEFPGGRNSPRFSRSPYA